MTNSSWEVAIAIYMVHLKMTREEAVRSLGVGDKKEKEIRYKKYSTKSESNYGK